MMLQTIRGMSACLALAALLFGASGCVEVHQLIKMQHDGSGTLTETVKVKPRALRLIANQEKRTGAKHSAIDFLSDEAVQARAKAFGEVTVKEKKLSDLPDGSKQIVILYTFQDLNKVRLYAAPLFKCNDKNATGQIRFTYQRITNWEKKRFWRADQLNVNFVRMPEQKIFSSPAVLQEYRQVAPIFLDMVREFKFRIEIQAPDDVEEYEKGMVVGMRIFDGNKVLVMNTEGANVIANPEVMRSFIQGEVGANWVSIQRGLPNTVTPWDMGDHGFSVRYLKLEEIPPPAAEAKK